MTGNLTSETYQLNWQVPTADVTKYYRISVVLLTNQLGVADVEAAPNASTLKNAKTLDIVPLADGRTLPIKFRIEKNALKQAVVTVNLATGGTVSTTFPGSTLPSGIAIPAQGTGALATITVEPCPDFNPRVTDLRTFGNCVRVTADPAITAANPLTVPATVFDCGVDAAVAAQGGVSYTQERRITLHQLDQDASGDHLQALPHAAACDNPLPPPEVIGALPSSLSGKVASLVHAQLKAVARRAMSYLSPKPAYAMMFIDLGGGGSTAFFSDYQFALPAKMQIVDGSDGIIGDVGTPLQPAVLVTDLGGEPVNGAVVHFFNGSPTATDANTVRSGTSGGAGLASAPWSIVPGPNTLTVSGRGIASPSNNGPRGVSVDPNGATVDTYFDPFQPIQDSFDGTGGSGAAVPVKTGLVTFSATGYSAPSDAFAFRSPDFIWTSGQTLPAGWETVAYQPGKGWSLAGAPFGSGTCGGATVTPWTINTDILVRKVFNTTSPGTLTFSVRIDNDLQIWLDGTEITSTGTTTNSQYSFYGPPPDGTPGNWWVHDNCGTNPDAPTFTVPTQTLTTLTSVAAGRHVLAIRAHDRGGDSYLDVQFSKNP